MVDFALIGAAGYIAPKHLQAIKDVGGNLVAAVDPHDSVGIIDSYFPECSFFTEFERFDRHCEKLRRQGHGIDYVSICSPNYLHDAHCRFALRIGADAICEKPLVLHERNLDSLKDMEEEKGRNIYTILQLRLHPEISKFNLWKTKFPMRIAIEYVTPRGKWYDHSWKGDVKKSGGLATNIGIHLFDLSVSLFGKCKNVTAWTENNRLCKGFMELQSAKVYWELSAEMGRSPVRKFIINDQEIELSNGFKDLHTKSYEQILAGKGFGIEDVRESVRICEIIRKTQHDNYS